MSISSVPKLVHLNSPQGVDSRCFDHDDGNSEGDHSSVSIVSAMKILSSIQDSNTADDAPNVGGNSLYEDFDFFSLHSFSTFNLVPNRRVEKRSTKLRARALQQIQVLDEKLRKQENFKVNLLNHCLTLQTRIAERETLTARSYYMEIIEEENKSLKCIMNGSGLKHTAQLRDLEQQMKRIDKEIALRDEKIRRLEAEVLKLKLLRFNRED